MMYRSSLAAIALILASSAALHAETIYGITDPTFVGDPSLVYFDSASPGTLNSVGTITGIVAGQTLRGIDFRASNGLLYAISTSSSGTAGQLYTIDLSTGAATTVGGGLTLTGNSSGRVSIDFNPVVDAIRVVTGTGQNYRVNANTGALINRDADINPGSPLISGVAYTNNFVGASQTTLYAYDFLSDEILTIGGVNGVPSPNTGTTSLVGGSGFVAFSAAMGFDISGATGTAYLSMDDFDSPDDNTEFFTVDLATGAMTSAGFFNTTLLDISVSPRGVVVPEPSSLALALSGLVAAGLVARSRRRRLSA